MPHPIGLVTRPQAAAGSAVLVSDSFNRADGSLDASSTDSYAGGSAATWGNQDGNFQIVSGHVEEHTGSNGKEIIVPVGQATMNVKCDITQTGNFHQAGIIAQWVNQGEFYMARLDHSGDVFELYKRVGFTYTSLGSTSAGGATSGTMELICTSGSQVVKWNGSTVLSASDTEVGSGTSAGLWSGFSSTSDNQWENLIVSAA